MTEHDQDQASDETLPESDEFESNIDGEEGDESESAFDDATDDESEGESSSLTEDWTPSGLAPSRRQTRSYLQNLLESYGLRPRRQFGQNFLIDLNLLELLVRAAEIPQGGVVLEVGAGTGGLTTQLASAAARVVSIEIDRGFYGLVSEAVRDFNNVTIVNTDVLAGKNQVAPAVLEALNTAMSEAGQSEYQLVANLPYEVSSMVISNLLLEDLPVRSMTVTVQLEMGDRILARQGRKDYGPLSVLASTVGEAQLIRTLPPEAFWPRPKVRSAIIKIDVKDRGDLPKLREFHRFVRDLFIHRRKNLRGSIVSIPRFKPLKASVAGMLEGIGLSAQDRAEQLSPKQLRTLYETLDQAAAPSES